jgi:hypothetical protein
LCKEREEWKRITEKTVMPVEEEEEEEPYDVPNF